MRKIFGEWIARWVTRSLTLAIVFGAIVAAVQTAVAFAVDFTGKLITGLYQVGLVIYAVGLLAQTLTALRENREVRQ